MLQVVVAIIYNEIKKILIALRPQHVHMGGLWEFPGGKIEAGESAFAALKRELNEELAIDVQEATTLMTIEHQYPDKSVCLNVWEVSAFNGVARGIEGQTLKWVTLDELLQYEFPEANKPIIQNLTIQDLR